MINRLGQVMLYLENQEAAITFWTEKAGFVVKSDQNNGQGMRWIEIAPSLSAETSLVLHNKALIAQMQPELNLGTPSLMFFSNDLEGLYERFKQKNVTVGQIVTMPSGKVFNFSDDEGNYFAVAAHE